MRGKKRAARAPGGDLSDARGKAMQPIPECMEAVPAQPARASATPPIPESGFGILRSRLRPAPADLDPATLFVDPA